MPNEVKLCHWEELFKKNVEGEPCDFKLCISSTDLTWVATDSASPNPGLILELLRSEVIVPQSIRNWIADLLDPCGDTNFQYKEFKRRKSGPPPSWNIDIALFIEARIENGDGYESAITAATEQFGIKRTAVTNSYSRLKKARRAEKESLKIQ